MSALTTLDYSAIHAEFIAGASLRAVCKRRNANYNTVQAYARRHKWHTQRKLAKDNARLATTQDTADTLKDRATAWIWRSTEAADRVLNAFLALDPGVKRQDVRMDADTLAKLVDAGRKAYGLDRQDQTTVRIGVWVGASGPSMVPADQAKPVQVIDVQSVDQSTGSAQGSDTPGDNDKGNPPGDVGAG